MSEDFYLLVLEGGGTRCQAVLVDHQGRALQTCGGGPVNTNFTPLNEVQQAVIEVVTGVLRQANLPGEAIAHFTSALVGPRFGPELFGQILPKAQYHYYNERDVIFAQGAVYKPHGIALVAATGATAWGVRADDGREVAFGGWGTLLGDEGSAYAVGLMALRQAVRAWEGRLDEPTRLVEAICQALNILPANLRSDLVKLAYGKPLTRTEIASLAPVVTGLVAAGDLVAQHIVTKAANDLSNLALHAARRLFKADEAFVCVAAGGLLNSGDLLVKPIQDRLLNEFSKVDFRIGRENPAIAVGKLSLANLKKW